MGDKLVGGPAGIRRVLVNIEYWIVLRPTDCRGGQAQCRAEKDPAG